MVESATAEPLTCCPLTPPGVGAIAVVALRGADAWRVIRDCVSSPRGALPNAGQPGRLYFGVFRDAGETIDDVILAPQYAAPERLIGVDISSHGGIRVVERILMTLTARGAQLVSAEATPSTSDWSARIRSQALQRTTRMTTRRSAMFLLVQSELLPKAYARILDLAQRGEKSTARAELKAIIERSRTARHIVSPAEISFVGPPNAGKSSLINALSGRDHVVVTDLPGTTRDWVTVPAAIMGVEMTLIDTAGLHDASDGLEVVAIARGQSRTDNCHLRIRVFDGSTAPPNLEQLTVILESQQDLVVCNKTDLTLQAKWRSLLEENQRGIISVSAASGDGLDELRTVIGTHLNLGQVDDSLPTEFDTDRLQRLSDVFEQSPDSATSLVDAIQQTLSLG